MARLNSGRLSFQIVNKAPTPINDLAAGVSVQPAEALRCSQQGPGNGISVGDKGRISLAVDCMRPFGDSVMLQLSYSCGGRPAVAYAIPLPVKVTCFFDPIVLDKGTFMDRWKAIDGGESETQETFLAGRQVTPDLLAALRSSILPSLHLGMATDIDSATTATACGAFKTG